MTVRRISAAETRPLRHRVLRAGQSFEQTIYSRDDHPETLHLGAFDESGELVGITSMYREPRPHRHDRFAWRLRGMATLPEVRGEGYGKEMLAACVEHVARAGGGELWCNARLPVVGFYRRAGFEVVGEPFDIDGIGPHVVMVRQVAPAGA